MIFLNRYSVIFFLFFLCLSSESGASIKTNKQLLDSCLQEYSLQINNLIQEIPNTGIFLKFDESPEYFQDFIISELISKKNKIFTKINEAELNQIINIKISFRNFKIEYVLLENDTYRRDFELEANSFIIDKNGEITNLKNFYSRMQDTLNSYELQIIEDPIYPFTKGKVPTSKSNWYDEILEPAIIITASIVSVVLFFTVRSK